MDVENLAGAALLSSDNLGVLLLVPSMSALPFHWDDREAQENNDNDNDNDNKEDNNKLRMYTILLFL